MAGVLASVTSDPVGGGVSASDCLSVFLTYLTCTSYSDWHSLLLVRCSDWHGLFLGSRNPPDLRLEAQGWRGWQWGQTGHSGMGLEEHRLKNKAVLLADVTHLLP